LSFFISEYKRPARVYHFSDFHDIRRLREMFHAALDVTIWLNSLNGL